MENRERKTTHNLNIFMYRFDEILDLFELTYTITLDDLKRAKKRVLQMHPDKSKLPSEYFLFYKKAFEQVIQYYDNNEKQNQKVPTVPVDYSPMKTSDMNRTTERKITQTIREMKPEEFQEKFNHVFEQNMMQKPDTQRNQWFSENDPLYQIDDNVNVNTMGRAMETIKQKTAAVVKYNGIENMTCSIAGSSNLYNDIDGDEHSDAYVTCDPFSKLKFDDLRKVHKDQTVFAVSETDIKNVPQYSSVDHFVRERGKQTMNPMEKSEAEKMLKMKEDAYKQKIMNFEHQSNLKTMEYEQKNKTVLSSFLLLENRR